MNDVIERFTIENKPLRGEYVYLTNSIKTILAQHPYPQAMKRLLAESLAIVSLLSVMIKLEGRVTLHFQGKENIKLLLAQCNSAHEIRGLIKYESGNDLSYEELIKNIQEGVLIVMLEFDNQPGKPYQGIVEWRGNTLTEAIEYYFENSEQLLTKIWLNYDEVNEVVKGCMLQSLPTKEENIPVEFFKIAEQIQQAWLDPNDSIEAKQFLQKAVPYDDVRLFDPVNVQFKCTCSREHSEAAIRLLGFHEAQDEVEKNGSLIVTCDFCMQSYPFDKIDIAAIFKNGRHNTSDTIH